MAYSAPTAADLKARFPEFASVDDVIVTAALAEAEGRVDASWPNEADFRLGRMLYAAHNLTLSGHGTGADVQFVSGALAGVRRYRSGSLEVERTGLAGAQSGVVIGDLNSTSYGTQFSRLVRLLFPPILVV